MITDEKTVFMTFAMVDYWIADDTTKLGFRPVYFKYVSN